MKLLVTGGTGFFGRALLRRWIDDEKYGTSLPEVTVLTRSPESFLLRYPEFFGKEWLSFYKAISLSIRACLTIRPLPIFCTAPLNLL